MVHGHSTTIPVYTKEIPAIQYYMAVDEEVPPPGDASALLTTSCTRSQPFRLSRGSISACAYDGRLQAHAQSVSKYSVICVDV